MAMKESTYLVSYGFKKKYLFFFKRLGKGRLELEVENGCIDNVNELNELENQLCQAYNFKQVLITNIQPLGI